MRRIIMVVTFIFLATAIIYAQQVVEGEVTFNNDVTFTSTAKVYSTLFADEVKAAEIHVEIDPFADYVFEEGYPLLSLEDVEAYIAAHGHLPGMRPGEEITEDGMDVGEVLVKQMEKIEELTRYGEEMNRPRRLSSRMSTTMPAWSRV